MATSSLFERGMTALDKGRTKKALCYFDVAKHIRGPHDTADIEHMRGICLRMLARYSVAETAFLVALEHAKTRIHKGRIKRDMAMIPLEQGNASDTRKLIDESLELLKPFETELLESELERQRHIEYFVSLGFDARLAATLEKRVDYAYQTYRQVRAELHGISPYELNTLVWEMKVAPLYQRTRRLLWRGQWLSLLSRNPKRFVQVLALALIRPIALRFG